MSISAVQVPDSPPVSWTTVNAQDKEADFLSLRLLNKRTRIRLSSQPLDLSAHDGKGNYFVISNTKGWFVAIARNSSGGHQLALSPLRDLRDAIVSSKTEGEDDLAPRRILEVAGAPIHLTLALNDERLVVGYSDGSISIYDTSGLFLPGQGAVQPLRTFPPGASGALRQVLGNTGDLPELVAVRRDAANGTDGLVVEVLDARDLQSIGGWRSNGNAVPTSIGWSAKGKQLAIGLKNGDIVTYSPSDTNSVKLHVPKPPSVGDSSVITLLWLSNQAFYGIYAPAGDISPEAPQKHVLTLYDPNTRSAIQNELEPPYYPSPGLRPPGAFAVIMRNWHPAKFLLFIGDSTSSDIGVVGSLAENSNSETWCNLSLEETSTPGVPLDKDAEDTVPLALDMDLASSRDDQTDSSSPVLYLYASDGTIQAWFVSNEKGGPYPSMVAPFSSATSSASEAKQVTEKPTTLSSFPRPSASTSPFSSPGFGATAPKFGQPAFGSTGFGGSSPQAQPSFGQVKSPTFGSTSFGQQTSISAFGQASAFGQSSSASAFGSSPQSAFGQSPSRGFGAFASTGPSKFSSPGFGFGSSSSPAPASATEPAHTPPTDAASPEAEMSEADDGEADNISGLSLGATSDSSKSQDRSTNSMFGSFGQSSAQEKTTSSPFSSGNNSSSSFGAFGNFGAAQGSSFVKPASGFGAFGTLTSTPSAFKPSEGFGAFGAKVSSTSPFTNPKAISNNAFSTPIKPVSAFGPGGSGPASAFQTSTNSTTPKFGTPSAPGSVSAFGKPAYSAPVAPSPGSTTPLATPTGNAFGSYSGSGGFSAFAKAGKPTSFSELLKAQKDEDTGPSKTPTSSREKEKDEQPFVSVPKPDEVDHDNLPPTPSTHGTFDEEDQDLGEDEDREDADSFISERFSEGSGDAQEEEQGEEEEIGSEEEESEEGEIEEEDASDNDAVEKSAVATNLRARTQSPASVPLPSTPESGDSTPKALTLEKKDSKSSESDAAASRKVSPAPIVTQISGDEQSTSKKAPPPKSPPPLFSKAGTSGIPTLFGKPLASADKPPAGTTKSASPSPPPTLFGRQPEASGDLAAKQPLPSVFSKPVITQSTTPPGSPDKPEEKETVMAPRPLIPAQTTTGSLGIGRPSSRPARSSPLAGTPVSGDDSKPPADSQTSQPAKPRPASPRLPSGQAPVPGTTQQQTLSTGSPKPSQITPPASTNLFGAAPKPTQTFGSAQGTTANPSAFRPPSLGAQTIPAPGSATFIMPPTGSTPQSDAGGKPPGTTVQQSQPAVQASFESAMQRECQNLYMSVVDEFGQFAAMSQVATKMRTILGRPSAWSHSRQDVGNKTKWTFGDLKAFRRVLQDLEGDVSAAYELKHEFAPLLREIESNLLKAKTRKEEIVRFSKAKADPEFAKMLRARTLGPDAAETQSQLRKQIRLIDDRVEQLESHLKSCKKRIEEHRRGKGSIKPPSLDTINRTYRNIDLAIESQTQQIEALTARVAKLKLNTLNTTSYGPSSSMRRVSGRKEVMRSSAGDADDDSNEASLRPQVTPSIAASTAAALNAERSALRLKNALANARKAPLLNTQAADSARKVPTLKPFPDGGKTGIEFPSNSGLSFDSLQGHDLDVPSENQRRPVRHSVHGKSVKLGKTQSQVPPSIATFDWGPLPKAPPMATLPSDLRLGGSSKK